MCAGNPDSSFKSTPPSDQPIPPQDAGGDCVDAASPLNAANPLDAAVSRADDINRIDALSRASALNAAIPAHSRLSDAELATLARGCQSPQHLECMLELFARHAAALSPAEATLPANRPFALLAEHVDDSRHDLSEWTHALSLFSDWLTAGQYPPQPLAMLLAYLSCTAEAQANTPMPLPLPHILADMLELYGYDGDTAISTEPEA